MLNAEVVRKQVSVITAETVCRVGAVIAAVNAQLASSCGIGREVVDWTILHTMPSRIETVVISGTCLNTRLGYFARICDHAC